MLETPENLESTHGRENLSVGSISRKDTDLAWLGAIIDGEGCVYAGFRNQQDDNNLTLRVTVYNTHPLIIRKVTEILCAWDIGFYVSRPHNPKKSKPGVCVTVGGKQRVKKLLELVIPYLYAKRRRAELAIELVDYREGLVVRAGKSKTCRFHGQTLQGEPKIKELVEKIRDEVHNYPSVTEFSRKANEPFGESSTTLRLPN